MGITDSKIDCDHLNREGLDNRRSNLRICTRAENRHNQRLRVDSSTHLKGVCYIPQCGKFRASITVDGKRKHLGHFASKYDAARCYDVCAIKAFGSFAATNSMLGLLPKPVRVTVQLTLELQA
jgi:hypothetical protein